MATMEEMYHKYGEQLKKLGVSVNEELLKKVTQELGPANFNTDAHTVATSDKGELETVFKNFVSKKLGVTDQEEGMRMIHEVAQKMHGEHNKYRAVFYYLLTALK